MGGIIHHLREFMYLFKKYDESGRLLQHTTKGDDPALVIECLNGYRLKGAPKNLETFHPIGIAEVIKEGKDITVLSYGSALRLVEEAARDLAQVGIEVEIIDAQSLLLLTVHILP